MSKIIEELHAQAKKEANELKINNVISTNDFILVEGSIYCKVYFAFYKHFIVCSGDYGEWQFDCTWETIEDKKPIIPTNVYYLCGKASNNCKKNRFDETLFKEEFAEWWAETKQDLELNLDEEQLEKAQELFEEFDSEGEYRVCAKLDEFMDSYEEITGDELAWESFSNMGTLPNIHFLINVYMLQKVREYFESKDNVSITKEH